MTITIDDTIECILEHADVVIPDITQVPTEVWLRERMKGIGGSDAAAALGLNPYRSPMSLYVEKADGVVTTEENERMWWGKFLEGRIIEGYCERYGVEVRRFPALLRSKEFPFMLVDLDAIGPGVVIEAKNTSIGREWRDGKVPDHYAIQGQHANVVTGLPATVFTPLIQGGEMLPIRVERNEHLAANLVTAEAAFWQLVQDHTPPEVDGSESTTRAVKALYPEADVGSVVQLDEDTRDMVGLIRHLEAQRDLLDADIEAYRNTLRMRMGRAEIAKVGNDVVATLKTQTRRPHEVAESTFRVLRFPKQK